jgi:CBS domain containing-hemolysin-like protein
MASFTVALVWCILGKEGLEISRSPVAPSLELKELVALHGEDQAGTLNKDEVSIVRAVLDLRDKTVDQIMTKMEDVFMLPLSARLDVKTIQLVCYLSFEKSVRY